MLQTMKYLKSWSSSMIGRPYKVHAETTVQASVPVLVTCAWAGDDDEDVSEPSTPDSLLLAAYSSSDDDCESLLSDDTVYGRRYRTVRLYGLASPRNAVTDPGTSAVLDVLALERAPGASRFQMYHSRGDFDSDTFSLSSSSTRYVEESFEASDGEDWEYNSHTSAGTK
eukprot:TRINITY_DN13575_c1_g1_i1.p1 TRINITY_DN13575_c1_g1~~TRINITY_DN13575_c1_g1_i1.p1  ORF type:complete len:169 (+),score=25.37 TRINITY_DN13575_c1_g1_i1:53-559(+)